MDLNPQPKDEKIQKEPMTELELAATIISEIDNSIGADDYSADQRALALDYYHGEKTGNLAAPSIPNRSSVVSKDLMDVVEWALPALMDMFSASDDVVRFIPHGPEDEKSAMDATNYIGFLMNRKNNGFITMHDAVKSSLIYRMGVTKTYIDQTFSYKEEQYEGISEMELSALKEDDDIEILELEEVPGEAPLSFNVQFPNQEPPQIPPAYNVKVTCRTPYIDFKWEGVPPEEIRIAKECREIDKCRFICHSRKVTLSDLRSLGYPEDLIESAISDLLQYDQDSIARHKYDGSWANLQSNREESQRTAVINEAYLYVDFDGDGIAEYRRVVSVQNAILENEVVDDHPFSLFTPILMPYKVIGLGFWDLISDLQEIKTALTRQLLDNAYQSNLNRSEVVEGQVNVDDLLQPQVGGMVRVKNPGMLREILPQSILQPGIQLLAEVDQWRDSRSGVTETNSALNAEALAKGDVGSQGVQALMQQGAQRIRLIARVLAETGIRRAYLLMLKLVTQHVDRPQQLKVNGNWLTIDPREWKDNYTLETSVGIGTFSRAQSIANLTLIGQAQQQAAPIGLATPLNIYNTLTKLTQTMGYRDSDAFWTAPQQGAQMPQPQGQPDPTAGLVAVEQAKGQWNLQKAQLDNQTKSQIAEGAIASTERVAMFEAQARIKLQQDAASHKDAQHASDQQTKLLMKAGDMQNDAAQRQHDAFAHVMDTASKLHTHTPKVAE